MVLDSSIDSGGMGAGASQPGASGDEISLAMPRKSAHDVYMVNAFNTLAKFNQIVFSMSGSTDPRVVPYTRQCINLILDDKTRSDIRKALKKALRYIESCKLPPEEKGSLQLEACQMAIGEVHTYLDEYIGIVKTNAVVPIASDPTPEEVAATMDILGKGGDIDVGGEEDTNPEKVVLGDPETISGPIDAPSSGGDKE